jgi:hypothetical protein
MSDDPTLTRIGIHGWADIWSDDPDTILLRDVLFETARRLGLTPVQLKPHAPGVQPYRKWAFIRVPLDDVLTRLRSDPEVSIDDLAALYYPNKNPTPEERKAAHKKVRTSISHLRKTCIIDVIAKAGPSGSRTYYYRLDPTLTAYSST